jgi:hypothetical protein
MTHNEGAHHRTMFKPIQGKFFSQKEVLVPPFFGLVAGKFLTYKRSISTTNGKKS